jgi:hypothetical protein
MCVGEWDCWPVLVAPAVSVHRIPDLLVLVKYVQRFDSTHVGKSSATYGEEYLVLRTLHAGEFSHPV